MPAAEPADLAATPAPPAPRRCENCGAPLYGEHCHTCGQPTKGLVRHFSSVLGDFFDTVFNIDSRVLRTLGPLLTRPGYLSLEYFAGRRVRYVTPMRLFLFLSLVAFFAIQGSIDINEAEEDEQGISINSDGDSDGDSIDRASTPAEVRAARDKALAGITQARKDVADVPGAAVGMDIAIEQINERADEQTQWLRERDAARIAGTPVPPRPRESRNNITFPNLNGKPWDPKTNPLAVAWLPGAVNKSLNRRLEHARDVLKASNNEKPIVEALFNVLPQTLIVLMPIFALMLKLAYWFKRRLYMEHLIVALHSHSFISLALIVVLLANWLQDWLTPASGFWHGLFSWIISLTAIWIPVYLLLMQKRVYAQGWPMTLLKFGVLGICYSVLLSMALVSAILIGLLTL